jgi:hypothetical protein
MVSTLFRCLLLYHFQHETIYQYIRITEDDVIKSPNGARCHGMTVQRVAYVNRELRLQVQAD